MCVIEKRTYQHSDGRREIFERVRPCRYAVGSSLCANVGVRNVEEANLIDRRPTTDRTDTDTLLVTEGFYGRWNVYREVDTRSGRRSSIRHSNTVNSPSPLASSSSRSSASFASYVERRPEASSPPPAAATFLLPAGPLRPTPSETGPVRTVRPDGTAVYDRPPSLDSPRAIDNERRTRFVEPASTRRSSISSIAAEVDDADTTIRRPRRPSISINTARVSPMSSSPSTSSPGLSHLPKLGSFRHDSARDLPQSRPRQDSIEERQRRRREEDDRQAQFERDRAAETDRQQQARQYATRDRHRADAAAALEGERQQQRRRQVNAELAQMARERAESAARQRDADAAQYANDRLRRDADATMGRRVQSSPRWIRRAAGGIANTSPLSARSVTYPITMHQYPTARRDSTLIEQGEAVIAREQTRAQREAPEASTSGRAQHASRRLSYVTGDLAIDDPRGVNVEYDLNDDQVSERLDRKVNRKAQRDVERAERRRDFWD